MFTGSIEEWARLLNASYDDFLSNYLNFKYNSSLSGLALCDPYRKMKCFFCIDIL